MMTKHERIKADKQRNGSEKSNSIKRNEQQYNDQIKAPGEDEFIITETPFLPELDKHADLLTGARSDKQRTSLVMQLQRTYGNNYVQQLINSKKVQAKLTINPPDDQYEKEADRVADIVTTKANYQVQKQDEEEELMEKPSSGIQRQEEEEELMEKPSSDIQRQEEEEEEEEALQTKPGSEMVAANAIETRINASRSSGQPLADTARTSLEPQFGRDLGEVRVHNDSEANNLSTRLGAEAFTTGKDIYFREGAYQPDTSDGKGLIAHELTHVIQQSEVPGLQRDALEGEEEEEEEIEQQAEQQAVEGAAPSATAEAPATTSTEAPSQTESAPTAAEGPAMTRDQAGLWRTLVITPLNEVIGQLDQAAPDWTAMSDTLNTVHQSIGSFTGAVSLPEYIQGNVESIRASVFDCYLMAESHASGGEMFRGNLRRAIDFATRVGG
jgi:hypothetical protein